jgi:hypothetical protein
MLQKTCKTASREEEGKKGRGGAVGDVYSTCSSKIDTNCNLCLNLTGFTTISNNTFYFYYFGIKSIFF